MDSGQRIAAPRRARWKLTPAKAVIFFLAFEWIAIVAFHFPYDTDTESPARRIEKSTPFYDQAYKPAIPVNSTVPEPESEYERVARRAAEEFHVEDQVREFARKYDLADAKVLEVGAGRGYLQDVVENYTGLDISPSVRRYFHKPFLEASATEMPVRDGEFDAIWTVWVLEHIPTPQNALLEMRRVLKDGGLLYLAPAWDCVPWAADGYEVRPYSDFGLSGKFTKASLSLRQSPLFISAYKYPIRAMRYAAWKGSGSPTRLHYTQLVPNYEKYWQADSDAVNSIDPYEAYLWFRSRGDECLNCGTDLQEMGEQRWPLILRIHKGGR